MGANFTGGTACSLPLQTVQCYYVNTKHMATFNHPYFACADFWKCRIWWSSCFSFDDDFLFKGQNPRSTYLLLGNIAMTDLVTALAAVYAYVYPRQYRNHNSCAFGMGRYIACKRRFYKICSWSQFIWEKLTPFFTCNRSGGQ